MVAKGVATNAVSNPAFKDVTVACIQAAELKYASYHLKDHFRGGNSRYCDAEKDMGMTNKVGMTKKIMTTTAKAYSHTRDWCVIWVSVAGCFSHFMI